MVGANKLNAKEFFADSKLARIIVPKAIVYSDESMISPIGHIVDNKLIKVGNPRKKNPDLVPIVVYGRLAYIELKNIKIESDSDQNINLKNGRSEEHNIDALLMKPEEKLNQNNSLFFTVQKFSAGSQTANLIETIDGVSNDQFLGLGANIIHRNSMSRIFWGLGYEYNALKSDHVILDFFQINPTVGLTPLKNPLLILDLLFSFDFSFNAQYKYNNYDIGPTPFYYGPNLSARVLLFPNQKYHLTGTLGFRSYKVIGFESLNDINNSMVINGITRMSGVNLGIGFGLEL